MKPQLVLLLLPIALPISAQITTDSSLGRTLDLPGPDYQIGADLGQQYGSNLFHSFQNFNLQSFESATFSGPNHIQNVISRVTGGNRSNINGTIRSMIPNADFYFLNPYGIMFGPNARLDVLGSFHASTADYLRLGQGGRFDVRNPSNSILTIAPIEAFGFLTDTPAKITTQSSKLSVPSEKTLSLIGGDIRLTSDTPLTADNTLAIPTVESDSILTAEYGRVNLASIASSGEVISNENDLILQGQGGQITIDNTLVEMSGYGGGAVFIRAGLFLLDNAIIHSNTLGNLNGKSINIKLTQAAYLTGLNSEISVITASEYDAGGILIEVPYLEVTGSLINTGTISTGQAGHIEIDAKEILLQDSAFIASGASDAGRSGDIRLDIEDTLSIIGYLPGYRILHGIEYENTRSAIFSVSIGAGHSGDIVINTKNLNLKIGQINTDSFSMGKGGDITINAKQIRLTEGGIISNRIYNQGKAGHINLNITDQFYIAGKAPFMTGELGVPFAGLKVEWEQVVFPSLIASSSFGTATGGMINIQANHFIMTDSGLIDASSIATGNAGDIFIRANHFEITNNGQITTSAKYAVGGNITLMIPYLLYLQDGVITTSVHGGEGNSGNISLENLQLAVFNQTQIKAQADAGNGGNIRIAAEHFIKSDESLITASSKFGLDGKIEIDSPNKNITEGMLSLPSEIVDVSGMMEKTCEASSAEAYENRSRFMINPIAGSPNSPFDLQPSRLLQPPIKMASTHQQLHQNLITHHLRQSRSSITCSINPPKIPAVRELDGRVIPKQLF